jgi:hypothetical protein
MNLFKIKKIRESRRSRNSNRKRDGSALIVTLFVVVVLSLLVGSFGYEAHLEAKYASYARDRVKASLLAESGFAIAEMLMDKQRGGGPGTSVPDDEDRWFDAAERIRLGQSITGLVEPVGDGYIILDIVPEPGRLNVNLLLREDWEILLDNIGLPEEYWQDIIDPVLDWMDADDVSNPKGAETEDYYSLLEPPYKAKNGPVDTVRELLLVKGFSEPILTGGIFDPVTLDDKIGERFSRFNRFSDTNEIVIAGIEHMLTTYGDGKINIQSAPYDVLRTLPDVDDILARAIMEEREDMVDDEPNPFASVEDLFARIEGLNSAIADKVTVKSQYYRITSTGRVGNIERKIWCIAYHGDRQLRYLRWVEEP